jgi:hypothetical protein
MPSARYFGTLNGGHGSDIDLINTTVFKNKEIR